MATGQAGFVEAGHGRCFGRDTGRVKPAIVLVASGKAFAGDAIMTRAYYPLKLPASVNAAAARLAREDGVSLDQWITAAIAQKIGVVETAADFLARRAGTATLVAAPLPGATNTMVVAAKPLLSKCSARLGVG